MKKASKIFFDDLDGAVNEITLNLAYIDSVSTIISNCLEEKETDEEIKFSQTEIQTLLNSIGLLGTLARQTAMKTELLYKLHQQGVQK